VKFRALTLALALGLLAAPAAARADLRVTPGHSSVFESAVGVPAPQQQFTITATCTTLLGTCVAPDTATVNVSITPSFSGSFSQTNNCPPTMTASTLNGPSCTVVVGFTPDLPGLAYAQLKAGKGGMGTSYGDQDGIAFAQLVGRGVEPHAAAKGETAKKRRKCKKRKLSPARAKKCRAKKKR
jgi:hypothetical protein